MKRESFYNIVSNETVCEWNEREKPWITGIENPGEGSNAADGEFNLVTRLVGWPSSMTTETKRRAAGAHRKKGASRDARNRRSTLSLSASWKGERRLQQENFKVGGQVQVAAIHRANA